MLSDDPRCQPIKRSTFEVINRGVSNEKRAIEAAGSTVSFCPDQHVCVCVWGGGGGG